MVKVRLQRFLSQGGVAARRKAEVLITSGRVSVGGRVVTELGTKIDPEREIVLVDRVRVKLQHKQYWILNKPKGCVSTVRDPEGRKTVMDLLPAEAVAAGVRPVGRLDYYTEGVLILTNDGELQHALLAPRSGVEKTYHVKIRGTVAPAHIVKMREGVRLSDGRTTLPAKVDLLQFTGVHTWLVITLGEGRSRQIHKMAEALGHRVLKLARVSFGGITYFGLKIGQARQLTRSEVMGLGRNSARRAQPDAKRGGQPRRAVGHPDRAPRGSRTGALRPPHAPFRAHRSTNRGLRPHKDG